MICSQLADGCLIDVFRNQNLHRVGEDHCSPDKKIMMMSILKGKLIIDAVIENKEVIINDLYADHIDPSYKEEIDFLKKFDIQSLVIIPLILSGRKIGAISFVNTGHGKVFHEDRITLLRGLCTHISSALERSRLHQTVATEAKNRYDLISLASHKIRTPLTSLKLQLQTSLKKISASEANTMKRAEVERFLDRLHLHMNNISEQVDKMIDLNEINQKIVLHKERVNLRELIFEVERSLIPAFEEAHCDVNLWADTDIWPMIDTNRIKNVIRNIFVSSMKFGNGQPIHITLSHMKGFAVLEVKDFGQRQVDGLGSIETESLRLDMSLSQTIIEEHGGSLEVEGNTLTVYLPV
jgi:signal transduction histidine kinase